MILIDDKVDMFCVWLWFPHSCWCCLERSWMCFPFALFSRKLQASHILTDRSQPRPQPETRTWIIWIIHDDPWLSKYPYVGWNRFWFSPPASWESLLHWSKSCPCEALCLAPVGWVLRIHEDSVSNIFQHVFLGASEMHLIVIYMVIMVLWHLVASLACMKFDVTAFPGRQVERRRPESGQQKASLWNYGPQLVRPRIYSLCTSKSESETVRSYQKTLSWCENSYSLHLFAWGVIQQILYICIYDPFQAGGCGLLWSYPGWCCNTCCGALHSDRSCAQEVQFKNNKEIDA